VDAVEHVERLAALDQVVLGDDFEPVDGGGAVEDFLIVLRPEPQAEAEIGRLFADHGPQLPKIRKCDRPRTPRPAAFAQS